MRVIVKDSKTIIQIDIKGYTIDFHHQQDHAFNALLLRDAVDEQLKYGMKTERQEEYQRGFKDAKAKRKKDDWSSSAYGDL